MLTPEEIAKFENRTGQENVTIQNEVSRLRIIDPLESGDPSLVGFQFRGSTKATDFELLARCWPDRYAKDNPDEYAAEVAACMGRFLQIMKAASIHPVYSQWAGALPRDARS